MPGQGGSAGFWFALAMAIIAGVPASTLFIPVVIPVLMKLATRHAGTS